MAPRAAASAGAGRRDGAEAARGRHPRPGDRQLHRLCPRRLPRPGGLRPRLRRRDHRSAGRLGHLPRDELPHRLEAVHVQPDLAASVGRRCGRRRWSCGATTTRSCRAAPASATRERCPTRASRSCAPAGHCVEMEQPEALARLVDGSSSRTEFARRCTAARRAQEERHACDVFHRAADVRLSGRDRARIRRHRADVLEQVFRSGCRQPALQRIPRAVHLRRGDGRRRLHAERAPQRAVLHAGEVQHLRRDPRRDDQEGEDRAARQSAAARREPGAARRRAGDDRHDLEGPAGLRLRARRRPGAARRTASTRPTTASASRRRTIWSSRRGRAQGPFRWEGTHYQHRVVNPWAVPLQKPYPRVWIPGVLSARRRSSGRRSSAIPISRSTPRSRRPRTSGSSTTRSRARCGYDAGPENRGYLQQVHVSDSEEKAEKNARQFMWMQGEFTGLAHPVWSSPSGYFSPEHRRQFVEFAVGRARKPARPPDLREAGRRRARSSPARPRR